MAGPLDPDDGGQQLLLGKMLLERGLITPDQLREALVERARTLSEGDRQATPLGGILVRKGFLTDAQLLGLMAEQGQENAPPESPAATATATPTASPGPSGPSLPAITAPDPLQDGGQLGKYRLVRELGRGGMGVVYEALDTQLNRRVALKLMLTNPNADPKERALEEERFVQEAQLSAKLKHPHIVTVYEAGLLEGRQFLSMELIEGQAFNDWRKTVTIREQVKVIADVSSAVHHAHEQGILHRDLKPRNILVSASGHSYVTDFGLAKSLGKNVHQSLTGSGAVVGTPAYMSPEQAQGLDRVDWRTDIYSLGVILYECMTGRTPFIGDSPIEILMKVVKDPVVPPLQVVDAGAALGLDKVVENICLKALAKKDRDRYVTAQALADDLTKWLAGEKVHVVVPKGPRKTVGKGWIVAALVLLALAGALFWLGISSTRQSPRAELELAKKCMDEENFSEALIHYRVALATEPGNSEALLGAKNASEGVARKEKERDEAIRARAESAFREAEELKIRAAELAQKEADAASDAERQKIAQERQRLDLALKRKAEEAAKAEEDFRHTQGMVVAPPGTAVDAWRDSINLMPLIDPRGNAIWGTWEVQEGGRLVCGRARESRVEIPFQLPPEYDFRMVFDRDSGAGSVDIILAMGGHQFRCLLGGEDNTLFAFESCRPGKAPELTAVHREPLCLRNGSTYTALIQVRTENVKAFLNGKLILTWETNFRDVALAPAWKLRNQTRLGLGAEQVEATFYRIEILEVTGKGRAQEASRPQMMRSVTVIPTSLKPGLVGEYFLGMDFQSLAVRRIDTSIDFRWNEGPAWPTGPTDCFSCRWTGYLHVQRTGKYYFSAAADDGVRVFLDDVQMLASWNGHTDAPRSFECLLEEGYHRFRLEYYEMAYLATIVLSWTSSPTQPPLPISGKSFYHGGGDQPAYMAPRLPELLSMNPGHSQNVTAVAFDPSGKYVAVAGEDRKVWLFDAATQRPLANPAVHPAGVLCVAFSPDGMTFATGARDNRVRVFDTQNRAELRTLEGPSAFVQCIAFSPDGKSLAAGSFDRTIRVWVLDGEGDSVVLEGHQGGVESIAFSLDGKELASVGLDHTLRTWDLKTLKQTRMIEGHADHVESVVFSPGGHTLATTGRDGLIKFWDRDTGRELKTISSHGDELMCLAFSPDGQILASGSNDGTVRVWDPVGGREIRSLPGHTSRVSSIAFAPTGRTLVSGSTDASIRFWSLDR